MPTDSAPAVAPPPFHADPAVHRALEARLRQTVKGEVQFDPASRALYATDSSNYRQVPIGIVCPRDADDAVAAVAACREFGAPVLSRGAGTSLAGQGCNVAVVLDFSRHCHRILDVDPGRRQARVQPGVVLDRLRDEAERVAFTFGPDPATHRWCTLGGMIGNNSCGVHSVMSGKTDDNIDELDILTYDGVRMRVGATPPEALESRIREGGRVGEIAPAEGDPAVHLPGGAVHGLPLVSAAVAGDLLERRVVGVIADIAPPFQERLEGVGVVGVGQAHANLL